MKFLYLTLLFLLLGIAATYCQKQGNIWLFGNAAGLNFNSGIPVPILTCNYGFVEGSASIASRTTGRLLFYTDGYRLLDSTNNYVPNSYPMGGYPSTTQGAVIVPRPGSNTIYYIFTVDTQAGDYYNPGDGGLNVSIMDMSLRGGLGALTTHDSLLLTPTTEKCATTPACDGINTWVVVHQWKSDAFYAYLVTANGISAPVISHSGIKNYDPINNENQETEGYMRISNNGKKLALAVGLGLNTVQLFDFNNSTGIVSNPHSDTNYPSAGGSAPYGVCFSPGNSKLYISYFGSTGNVVYQYNLLAASDTAIIESRISIEITDSTLAAIQQGPDGKLYIAKSSGYFLSVINNPDSLGAACNYVVNGVSLGGKQSLLGLPDIILNNIIPPLYDSTEIHTQTSTICSEQSVLITATGYSSYHWSPSASLNIATGDTVIANPVANTTYTVIGTATNGCSFSDSIVINVVKPGTLNIIASPDTICSGNSSTLTASLGSGNYTWAPAIGLTDSTGAIITVSPTITTVYIVTSPGTLCNSVGQITLTVANNTIGGKLTTIGDTLCEGLLGSLILSGNSSNILQWQSSTTGNSYTSLAGSHAMDTTKYTTAPLNMNTWFRVLVGSGGCAAISDTLELIVAPPLTALFKYNVSNNSVSFNSDSSKGHILGYNWEFGDGTTSTQPNPLHVYKNDSSYTVCLTIYDNYHCSYTNCIGVTITSNGIASIPAQGGWNIYPNPFVNEITLDGETIAEPLEHAEMYDVLGRQVLDQFFSIGNSTFTINTSSLPNGIYFLKIRTTGSDYVQKMIKQ